MDISSFASFIGALGIGSFVGQYLIGAQSRRQARSEVLLRLAECEDARWAVLSDHPTLPFHKSVGELEKAALISGAPRKLVEHYKVLAYIVWWKSSSDAEERPNAHDAGERVGDELAGLTRQAAWDLSRVLWHPWAGRLGMRHRIGKRFARVAVIEPSLLRAAVQFLGGKSLPPRPDIPIPAAPPPPAPVSEDNPSEERQP